MEYPSPNGYTDAVFEGFAAGFTSAANATATDKAADTITFLNDPGWTTGMAVRVSTTGGGLTANTDYFVRNLTGGKYALFDRQAAASGTGTTGRLDLTTNIAATVSPSPAIASTGTDTDSITFSNDPGWATGFSVRVSTTGGGLTAGREYFVRNLTGGRYSFFNDLAAASGTSNAGLVDLTALISTTVSPIPSVISGNAFDLTNETITFLKDPGWPTGQFVRAVNPAFNSGGLRDGAGYYVRNLGGGKYSFFNTKEYALATGTYDRVDLTADVSLAFEPPVYFPDSTSTADSTTYFPSYYTPNWPTGTPVRVIATGGGLTAGRDYFVRNLEGSSGPGFYAFYDNEADAFSATGTTGRVPLTGTIGNVKANNLTVENDWVTMSIDPNWASGTPVQVSTTGGGLTALVDYFVRNLGSSRYEFFTSQAAASGTGTAGRVELNAAGLSTLIVSPYPSSATVDGNLATFSTDRIWSAVDDDWITLPSNPNWATGTLVRASTTGGGFTAGVDYFVRDLTGGKYAFFTTQAAASGTGSAGRVGLIAGASVTLSPNLLSATVENDWVTMSTDPNWASGTPVQVSTTGGGLTALVDYFVRSLGSGRYEFFTSQAAAAGTSSAGRVRLTGSIGAASRSYSDAALSTLLNTASTAILAKATETELRQNLTAGGDLYNDRFGAFYLNGVRTQAMDVAVTSRLLVQDNVSSEYKTLMDELAERNNLIAAARQVLSGGQPGLAAALTSLRQQYGFADVLSVLTAGQYSDFDVIKYNAAPSATLGQISVDASPSGDYVTGFEAEALWQTGTAVRSDSLRGGLEPEFIYFVNRYTRSSGQIAFQIFENPIDAASGANPVDITDSFSNGLSSRGEVTFSTDPDWPSGTSVQASASGGGLYAGREYYVRNLGGGKYSFFENAQQAEDTGGNDGLVLLTARITALISNGAPAANVYDSITPLLNTLISNKVRDGDLDQAKLQTLTAQLQNNTEAMTAMIKAFSDMNSALAQALR